jgi:hypothetical protein
MTIRSKFALLSDVTVILTPFLAANAPPPVSRAASTLEMIITVHCATLKEE